MAIYISSNHFSLATQVRDAVHYLATERPDEHRELVKEFPDLLDWVMDPFAVDVEYECWVADWIESHTPIMWEEGEPFLYEPDDFLIRYNGEVEGGWELEVCGEVVDSGTLMDLYYDTPQATVRVDR